MIKVNQVEISEEDIAQEMQYHPAENKRAAKVQAAESLIIGELLKQQAKNVGIQEGESYATAADEEKVLDQLIAKEVDIPQATDDECERYFDANPEKFSGTTILEVRHLLLAAAPDDPSERDEQGALAETLLQRLKDNPYAFDDLVTQYSACPSKEQGGNLGQISKGQTVPEFEKPLMAAKEGLVDYPIESRYGYHLTFVDRKIEGKPLEFKMVADKIKMFLNDRVKRKAVSQYIETLIAAAKIEGFDFNVGGEPLMQ